MRQTSHLVRLSIFYVLSLKFFCVAQEPERSPDYDVISDEFLRQNRDALLQLTTPQDPDEGDASWAKQDVDIPGSTVDSRILPEDLRSHTEDESTTMSTALDVVEEIVLTENATVIVVNVTARPFWDAVLSTFAERNHEVFDPLTTPLPAETEIVTTADHHSSRTEELEQNIDIEDDYADDSVTDSTPTTGSTITAVFLPDGNLSIITDSRNLTLSIVPVVVVHEDETSTATTENLLNTTTEVIATTEDVSTTEEVHVNSTMGLEMENDTLADAVGVTLVNLDSNSTVNVSWSNQDRLDDVVDLNVTANSSSTSESETSTAETPEDRSLYTTPCARCEFDTTLPSWMPTTTEEDPDRPHPVQIFAHVIHAYSMIIFGLAIIFLVVLCCCYASFCQRVVKRRRNDAKDKAGHNKGADDALLTQI